MIDKKFNIIIPLGGLGKRFNDANYSFPKPLIKVYGKCIINWVIDCIPLKNVDSIIIPYNRILSNYNFESKLKKDYPTIHFIFYKLEKETRGAAETVLLSIDHYIQNNNNNDNENNNNKNNKNNNNKDLDIPVICMDGDNFYTTHIIDKWNYDNGICLFEDLEPYEIYSYVKLNSNNGTISDIIEKKKVSNFASTGMYLFSSILKLRHYCQYTINNDIIQKGEYYLSSVFKSMINMGETIYPYYISKESFKCLGTPIQVKLFTQNNLDLMPVKRYCFDLDNTLVSYPQVKGDYTTVLPLEENIKLLRKLKALGNTIIIYTARRMLSKLGNIGKVLKDQGQIVFETLEHFNIPYDEIYFGKPYADFYIDDLAINAFSNLDKELGFYDNEIECRDFNSIENKDDSVKKISKEKNGLKGEINYYLILPEILSHLFPTMLDYDDINYQWYKMTKINGVPISKLFLDEELKKEHIDLIISNIDTIHQYDLNHLKNKESGNHKDIYKNYVTKLKSRYENNKDFYSNFKKIETTYFNLLEQIKIYEEKDEGKLSMIHGDLVFTNILIDKNNNIKFIDMRGKLGDKCTNIGDIYYDYAKIYQSLIGYDEILMNKNLNLIYKNEMIRYFETLIIKKFNLDVLNNIKLITKTLLFSLLPLHNNSKCVNYYELIFNM